MYLIFIYYLDLNLSLYSGNTKFDDNRKVLMSVGRTLMQRTNREKFSKWNLAERLSKREAPNSATQEEDRGQILKKTTRFTQKPLSKVNIGAIFNRYLF